MTQDHHSEQPLYKVPSETSVISLFQFCPCTRTEAHGLSRPYVSPNWNFTEIIVDACVMQLWENTEDPPLFMLPIFPQWLAAMLFELFCSFADIFSSINASPSDGFSPPQEPTLASNLLLTWIQEKMVDKVIRATCAARMNGARVQA